MNRKLKLLSTGLLAFLASATACGGKLYGVDEIPEEECLRLTPNEACKKPACRSLVVSRCGPDSKGRYSCELASDREACDWPRGLTLHCPKGEGCESFSYESCTDDLEAKKGSRGICSPRDPP